MRRNVVTTTASSSPNKNGELHLTTLPNTRAKRRKRSRSSSTWALAVVILIPPALILYDLTAGKSLALRPSDHIIPFNSTVYRQSSPEMKPNSVESHSNPYPKHKIPRILTFTYSKNLLTEDPSSFDDEEVALADNLRHGISLHPDAEIHMLTDRDCISSLQRVYPALVQYFEGEKKGMFKADICRGSALYETGGFYLDADVGVRHDLWSNLAAETEFVTVRVHAASAHRGNFFQAMIGVAPQSPIVYKYLQLFEAYYQSKEDKDDGQDKNSLDGKPLGVILLRRAWDATYDEETHTPLTTLWQEILYNPKLFPTLTPAPVWGGDKRACHFVVASKALYEDTVDEEVTYTSNKEGSTTQTQKMHIPAYSRIAGSRMCSEAAMQQRAREQKKKEHATR